jgi:hypothetical protein
MALIAGSRADEHVCPVPLQQIFEFTFTLEPQFWQGTLPLTPEQRAFASAAGTFPWLIIIERWRSHRSIQVYETALSPEMTPASLMSLLSVTRPTRSILKDGPFDGMLDVTVLGRIEFGPRSIQEPPLRLELYIEEDRMRLGAVFGQFGEGMRHGHGGPFPGPLDSAVFFDVPLALKKLADFKEPDADVHSEHVSDYAQANAATGVSWSLRVRDLEKACQF